MMKRQLENKDYSNLLSDMVSNWYVRSLCPGMRAITLDRGDDKNILFY
jgi:hypothetical protein